ncbi:hypothetical protein Pfo_024190, partial [Paulownia fortunei]
MDVFMKNCFCDVAKDNKLKKCGSTIGVALCVPKKVGDYAYYENLCTNYLYKSLSQPSPSVYATTSHAAARSNSVASPPLIGFQVSIAYVQIELKLKFFEDYFFSFFNYQ